MKSLFWISILGIICFVSWIHQAYYDFEHDDAYITFRYAKNWASGAGPVFNLGEKVEGYTNFLFLALLTLGIKGGIDPVFLARFMGTLSCFLLIFGMAWFSQKMMQQKSSIALWGALGIALHAGIAVWARSGMETLLFTTCLFFAQFRFLWEIQQKTSHWCSGGLFAIVALCRADGFLFYGFALLFLGAQKKKTWRSLSFSFLLLFLPYFFWRWNYYGFVFPNTYYAKTGGTPYQQIRGIFYSYQYVSAFGGAFLFALPALLLLFRESSKALFRFYLGFILLGGIAFIVWVGGDHMPMSRFFVPFVPFFLLLWIEVISEIVPRLISSAMLQKITSIFLLSIVVGSGLFPTFNQRRFPYAHVIQTKSLLTQWKMTGLWLKKEFPPNTYLAVSAIGAIAYFSEFKTLDQLGLTDLHIAHLQIRTMGRGTAGHEKQDSSYVRTQKPDLILHNIVEFPEMPHQETYSEGVTYERQTIYLGEGPITNFFGETRIVPLYVLCEKKISP